MIVHSPRDLAQLGRRTRKKLKLSQTQAGDAVGLKQATFSAFENNPEGTKLDTLFRILSALDLELHILEKHGEEKKQLSASWTEEW